MCVHNLEMSIELISLIVVFDLSVEATNCLPPESLKCSHA